MSKKNFAVGLDLLLGEGETKIVKTKEKPAEQPKVKMIRVTLIVDEQMMNDIKAIAFWERTTIKNLINSGIKEEIERHKTNGKIKPLPKIL